MKFSKVSMLEVSSAQAGQRLDNFLVKLLKGVPKSRIYRIVRRGEVRVNRKRCKPDYKLQAGDHLRLPPIRVDDKQTPRLLPALINPARYAVYEDDSLIVLNKPSGLAVHGGSGVDAGIIEAWRKCYPENTAVELVHRIDRQTSGCLMLAKSRDALLRLQEQLAVSDENRMGKTYIALVHGHWPRTARRLQHNLKRGQLSSGERLMQISEQGNTAVSDFNVLENFQNSSLVKVQILTGRTHQVRAQAAAEGHPLAGDDKYGDREFNHAMRKIGLNRLFLHARALDFIHPKTKKKISVSASLPTDLVHVLEGLRHG